MFVHVFQSTIFSNCNDHSCGMNICSNLISNKFRIFAYAVLHVCVYFLNRNFKKFVIHDHVHREHTCVNLGFFFFKFVNTHVCVLGIDKEIIFPMLWTIWGLKRAPLKNGVSFSKFNIEVHYVVVVLTFELCMKLVLVMN